LQSLQTTRSFLVVDGPGRSFRETNDGVLVSRDNPLVLYSVRSGAGLEQWARPFRPKMFLAHAAAPTENAGAGWFEACSFHHMMFPIPRDDQYSNEEATRRELL
jgi:hypothetical protein